MVGDPLNELPVRCGKQFLLVRRAHREVHEIGNGFFAITRARPAHDELHLERVKVGFFVLRLRRGHGPDRGAWSVQVIRRGREHPVFKLGKHLALLLGGLNFVEALDVRVLAQLRGHLAAGPQEYHGQRLQPFLALGLGDGIPPLIAREIFPAELELVEIILQQQPRSLLVLACGKQLEDIRALIGILPRAAQLTAQIRQHAIRIL